MTREEFLILKTPEARKLVEENIGEDPARLALALKCGREEARAMCGQVKYLQRGKTKLPSYYAARCIIPPLAYEQCSSEATAASKEYSGRLCIDLTCGLGVDSMHLSNKFDNVISIERDPVMASIGEYNFGLLGAKNITVVNSAAEDFMKSYSGEKASLIFVDPARRGSKGEKLVLTRDCSPDVAGLMPSMLEKADKVLIKLSPMFDVDEALNLFSPYVSKVETVSVKNECKELLVELSQNAESPVIEINIIGRGRYSFGECDTGRKRNDEIPYGSLSGKYLLIPDAAFYKSRLTAALLEKYFPDTAMNMSSAEGFAFTDTAPGGFPGRIFRIDGVIEYQPRALKKILKERGVKRINIIKRHFPYSSDAICNSLKVVEGGSLSIAFTKISGKSFALFIDVI